MSYGDHFVQRCFKSNAPIGPSHSAHVLGGKNGTSRPFNGCWHRHPDSNRPVNCRSVSSLPSQCERVVEDKSPPCVCQRTDASPLSFYTYQFSLSLSFWLWWYDLRTTHARTNRSCESDLFNESVEPLPKTAENDSLGIASSLKKMKIFIIYSPFWLIW